MASTENNRASAAALNAEVRRTKARLMDEVPKLRKLALKKVNLLDFHLCSKSYMCKFEILELRFVPFIRLVLVMCFIVYVVCYYSSCYKSETHFNLVQIIIFFFVFLFWIAADANC